MIETYVDIFRVSHSFEYCQSLGFIAESTTGALKIGMDDVTIFFEPLIFADTLELSKVFNGSETFGTL